jgi:hypothetical protein
MSGTGAPASPPKRAAIVLAGLLCLGLGLWALLSTRSPAKMVDADFTCEELELPAAVQLNLNFGRTQLRTTRLWGFEGTVANVGQSAGTAGKHTAAGGRLSFEPLQAEPAPFIEMVPDGAFGAMSIEAGAGAVLKPADIRDGGVCLQFLVPAGIGANLHVNSDSIHLRATRYNLAPAGIGQDVPVTLTSMSPTQPLLAEFRSAPPQAGPDQAQLCFQKVENEIALVEPGKTKPIDVGDEVKFGGVLNPSIKIEGYRDLPARAADRKTDLVIAGKGLRLTGLFLSRAEHGRSAMRITAAGVARSIRQGGREILPSWLEDISEEWWTKRGLWLVVAGLVLVIFRKLIDRALDILLKKLLPE